MGHRGQGQGQIAIPSPSFFVCLRGPSCVFVDSSFFLLFQASRHLEGVPALYDEARLDAPQPERLKRGLAW